MRLVTIGIVWYMMYVRRKKNSHRKKTKILLDHIIRYYSHPHFRIFDLKFEI